MREPSQAWLTIGSLCLLVAGLATYGMTQALVQVGLVSPPIEVNSVAPVLTAGSGCLFAVGLIGLGLAAFFCLFSVQN